MKFAYSIIVPMLALSIAQAAPKKQNKTQVRRAVPVTAPVRASTETSTEPVSQAGSDSGRIEAQIPSSDRPTTGEREVMQLLFQPRGGEFAMFLGPQVTTQAFSSRWGHSASTARSMAIELAGGIADQFMLGVASNYGDEKSHSSSSESGQVSGWSDINFKAQGFARLGESSLAIFGLKYDYSPDIRKMNGESRDGRTVDGNRFSGGNTLQPYAGLQFDLARRMRFATTLSQEFRSEQKSKDYWDDSESSRKGGDGTTLVVALEKAISRHHIGGALAHVWYSPSQYQENGQTRGYSDAINMAAASVYGVIQASERFAIRPGVNYMTIPDRDRFKGLRIEQYDVSEFSLKALLTL